MHSQTLAEIQFPSNGKHVIAYNLILITVSNNNNKNHIFKIKHTPFKQTPEGQIFWYNKLTTSFSTLHKTENVSSIFNAISFSILNFKNMSSCMTMTAAEIFRNFSMLWIVDFT